MSLGLEDLLDSRRQAAEKKRGAEIDQLRMREHVMLILRDLEADPKWQVLAEHIATESAYIEKQVEYHKARLEGGEFLDPKEYGQLKMKLESAKGYLRGLNRGLALMSELIKTGEIAKQKIEEIVADSDSV